MAVGLPDGSSNSSKRLVACLPLTQQQLHRAGQFALDNFMLLSFSCAAALAMAWPLPGKLIASWTVGDVRIVQAVNNFLVFLISGLTLKSDEFRQVAKRTDGTMCVCV